MRLQLSEKLPEVLVILKDRIDNGKLEEDAGTKMRNNDKMVLEGCLHLYSAHIQWREKRKCLSDL